MDGGYTPLDDDEEEEERVPSLTSIEQNQAAAVSATTDDTITALNTPIESTRRSTKDGEFRLSAEMPPPTVMEDYERRRSSNVPNKSITEETQKRPSSQADGEPPPFESPTEETNTTAVDCANEECPFEKITLGEAEAEQLKAVGQHLFQIGKALLEEMNFVETLLNKVSPLFCDSNKAERFSRSGQNGGLEAVDAHEQLRKSIECSVDTVNKQTQRLSWIQQVTDEYKQAAKAAKFGSAFVSPRGSETIAEETAPNPMTPKKLSVEVGKTDAGSGDLSNRLAALESKVEGLYSRLGNFEHSLADTKGSLQGLINTVSDEFAALRTQLSSSNGTEGRINNLELRLLALARTVWELRCETRAQMHFGKEECQKSE